MQLQHRIAEMAPAIAGLTTAGAIAGGAAGSVILGSIAGCAGAIGGVTIAHAQRQTRVELLLAPYSHLRPRSAR